MLYKCILLSSETDTSFEPSWLYATPQTWSAWQVVKARYKHKLNQIPRIPQIFQNNTLFWFFKIPFIQGKVNKHAPIQKRLIWLATTFVNWKKKSVGFCTLETLLFWSNRYAIQMYTFVFWNRHKFWTIMIVGQRGRPQRTSAIFRGGGGTQLQTFADVRGGGVSGMQTSTFF